LTCTNHRHQEEYTAEQFEKMTNCSRCSKLYDKEGKRCDICKEASRQSNMIVAQKRKLKPKCKGIKEKNVKCTLPAQIGSSTCWQHNFQKNYTDEQMVNLTDCSGCHKALFKPPGYCQSCLDIGKIEREKVKEKKKTQLDCLKCLEIFKNNEDDHDEDDKNDENIKKSKIRKQINGTKYCGKHAINVWVDEVKARDKMPCTQYIRGCRNELDIESKCVACLPCRCNPETRLRDIKKEAIKIGRKIELTDNEIL
jgi:hypothetical protein